MKKMYPLYISEQKQEEKLKQPDKLREGGQMPYISWFMNVYETVT